MTKVIEMKDPTGATARGYIGFNAVILLFGPWAPLFRGHLSAFAIMIATYFGGGMAAAAAIGGTDQDMQGAVAVSSLCLSIVYACTYNSWHRSWLLKRGYVPISAAQDLQDKMPAYVRDIEAKLAEKKAPEAPRDDHPTIMVDRG